MDNTVAFFTVIGMLFVGFICLLLILAIFSVIIDKITGR